jgi:hypothetical protein
MAKQVLLILIGITKVSQSGFFVEAKSLALNSTDGEKMNESSVQT